MDYKLIEVRDKGTRIDCLAVRMRANGPVERYYLERSGYPREDTFSVVLMTLSDQRATSDPYGWTGLGLGLRTMPTAHAELIENWVSYPSGSVVDVEFIRGERPNAKIPERFELERT